MWLPIFLSDSMACLGGSHWISAATVLLGPAAPTQGREPDSELTWKSSARLCNGKEPVPASDSFQTPADPLSPTATPPPPALNPQQGLLLGPLAVEPVSATAWLPEEPLPRKAISPQRSVNKYLQSPLTVPRENTNQTQQALDRPPQGCGEAPAVQGLAVC